VVVIANTTNYGLYVTDDNTETFQSWREAMNGTTNSNMTKIDNVLAARTKIYTGYCTVSAATTEKTVTLDDTTGFSLAAGVMVVVRFTYGNSATTPTLNVNSTGAKNIVISSGVTSYMPGGGTTFNTWGARETILFTYTGSSGYWTHIPSGYLGYLAYDLANGKADASHQHGNIQNNGTLQTSDITIANGDKLVITDSDDSAKVARASISFDGSTTTQYLSKKGTWENTPTIPSASTTTPSMDGPASYGSGTTWARADHVHPTDTSRAALASPTFTGTPKAPTATTGTNTTQIATTAFVQNTLNAKITYGTSDMTPGQSALATGDIYLMYEQQ